jgi:hypothetical protein
LATSQSLKYQGNKERKRRETPLSLSLLCVCYRLGLGGSERERIEKGGKEMKFLADIVEPAVFITYNVATFPGRILNHHGGVRLSSE